MKKFQLENKYSFKTEYVSDVNLFQKKILDKSIVPYQVEFQAPPRGEKICWLECPYCYGLSADNNKERLSKERALVLMDQMIAGGIKKFIFAGYATDPLNCSYIEDLLKVTIQSKCIFGFNTKALRVSDKFINILKDNEISSDSYISLSVDACSNDTYNKIHAVKSKAKIYDNVLKNARRLGESKNINYFDMSAAYLVNSNSANRKDYENFIKDFSSAGCNVLRFTFPQQPKDIDTPDGTIPSPQDIEKYINELQEFKYKYENDNLLILILNKDKDEDIYMKPRTLPCYARYIYPTIGFDGWLYNCSQSSSPNFRSSALGDLTKKNFWELFYDYDNKNFNNYFKKCNDKIAQSNCRCDRKEHVTNKKLKLLCKEFD